MIARIGDIIVSPSPPSSSDLRRIAAGDQLSCRKLIDSWEIPIHIIASRYASRSTDLDDLAQVGRMAVYRAALNYDLSLGAFGNYTKRAIRNEILKESERLARQRRLEEPLQSIQEAMVQEMVDDDWLPDLPEPHSTIFQLLYVEGRRQQSAAQEMGVSQPRVSQLHKAFRNFARQTLVS